MVDVSVCVEMVYDDDPFEERVTRAGAVDADAVEFWGWREKDLDAIEAAAGEGDVPVVGCVAGGTLTDPEGIEELETDVAIVDRG